MNAITAVKKTVAPIPAYLFCSPMEQLSKILVSEPEQMIKNCFNMIDEVLIDEILERKSYINVTKKPRNIEALTFGRFLQSISL